MTIMAGPGPLSEESGNDMRVRACGYVFLVSAAV